MDRQQILDLYTWKPGVCFRHPGQGEVPTALVKTILPRAGEPEQIRACEDCVLAMEWERLAAAQTEGLPYEPGHVGELLE